MAISSINMQISTVHAFAHNDRTSKVTYTIARSENNEYDRTAVEAQKYYMRLKQEATENYKARTGQRLQTKEEKLRWTAVVNLNAGHTLEHVKNLTVALEQKYGWQTIQIAVHRDEGHITAEGKKERNLHAHLEFFMLDKQGLYKFKKKDFRLKDMEALQTFVAQQLQMDRGQSKKETGRERLEHKEYKAVKQAEQAVQEQAQTKIEQAKKELERSAQETAELKARFEEFRKTLIQEGKHSKEDYNALGSLKKEVVNNKKIGTAEALKMLEQLKTKLKEIQEPKLADKLIASATTKTLTGQKIDTPVLKENLEIVFDSINNIVQQAQDNIQKIIKNLGEKRQKGFLKEFAEIRDVITSKELNKETAQKLLEDYVNYVKNNKKLDWETTKTGLDFIAEMRKEGHHTLGNFKDVWELKEKALLEKAGAKTLKIWLNNLKPKLETNRLYFIETKINWTTEFKGKVVDTIKNIEKNRIRENIEDLQQENVLERMMRGLNAIFSKAKRIIKKQKETILKLKDIIKKQETKIKDLEKNLIESKEKITDEMIIKHIEDKFLHQHAGNETENGMGKKEGKEIGKKDNVRRR